jgi:hypothetical protein
MIKILSNVLHLCITIIFSSVLNLRIMITNLSIVLHLFGMIILTSVLNLRI